MIFPQDKLHDKVVCPVGCLVEGGLTSATVMASKESPGMKIALVVAANSGRPGGSCGTVGGVRSIKDGHKTAEESIMSNWLRAETKVSE